MEALTPWHILAIAVAFVLLFASHKLPEASRAIGRSLRIFRAELLEPTEADRLEAEARQAEAKAAALRARARGAGSDAAAGTPPS